ncbi:hypothetical protein [Massilia rubra]|uniref:hypothetical protein n=1 Tax=Massilia rubra TaxID=2607910 RepID=UPI001420BC1D|nr:hypothetical protein [Massilia rubra]
MRLAKRCNGKQLAKRIAGHDREVSGGKANSTSPRAFAGADGQDRRDGAPRTSEHLANYLDLLCNFFFSLPIDTVSQIRGMLWKSSGIALQSVSAGRHQAALIVTIGRILATRHYRKTPGEATHAPIEHALGRP